MPRLATTCHEVNGIHHFSNLNFPIRSRCVFKAIIKQNSELFMVTWEKKTSVSCIVCVCCILMSCSEIFQSQDGNFQHCFCQPWWWPLVSTSLIFQFWENVSSFNFLANALGMATLKIFHNARLILRNEKFFPALHYAKVQNFKIAKVD